MFTVLCPIDKTDLFYFVSFDEDLKVLAEGKTNKVEQHCVCFGTLLSLLTTDCVVYDVKTIYSLLGQKTDSLNDLFEHIPLFTLKQYERTFEKVKAYYNSFASCKIDWTKHSMDRMLPESLVRDFYYWKAHLVANLYKKVSNEPVMSFYGSFYENLKTLYKVVSSPIKIDVDFLNAQESNHHTDMIKKNLVSDLIYLKINPVGAKTGRLSFKKNTPNIYILPKILRDCIVAEDGTFIAQFDFKSFQPRLAIYSTKDDKFKQTFAGNRDIYSVFPGDRSKNKIAFLAWMFSDKPNEVFDNFAKPILDFKNKLKEEATMNGFVKNPFGRILSFDKEEEKSIIFQNYITSVEVDYVLSVMTKINNTLLAGKKSKILFPYHDAIVFQISNDEKHLLNQIKDLMENFSEQEHYVEIQVGNSFGTMDSYKEN